MTSRLAVAATTRTEEEIEHFLLSMLGDDSELNLGVVRDVLCACGYEVEKALDVLLDLSSSSSRKRRNSSGPNDVEVLAGSIEDHRSTNTSSNRRNYVEVLAGSPEAHRNAINNSNLSQVVLESLFQSPKTSVKERRTKNWKVVKELQESLEPQIGGVAKEAEYDVFRGRAKQIWDSTTACHQKAAIAYSSGSLQHAGYYSEQAKEMAKKAREEDEKASQEIFKSRNKDKGIVDDVLTIDLHGQHVKEAMKLLKIHLLYGANSPLLHYLRVITGHGAVRSIVKQSVTRFFQNERIKWTEENPGAVMIKLPSQKEVDNFRYVRKEVQVIT